MRLLFIPFLFFIFSCVQQNHASRMSNILVHDMVEFNQAVKKASPGDVITLANGVWKDADFIFKGHGTREKPITLTVEEKGKVTLEGKSSLKLAGQYLIVDGLYFKNGYTPLNAVIQFKIDDDHVANHSRLTNSVIDEFTQPNRGIKDHWIELWGRHNKIDHNHISGKSNSGPTVRVFLKGNKNIKSHHQIVHNHFGPRPRKGGPHAETIQIGSSTTSMTPSYVNVSNNLFYRSNGEVEVISSKSNFNEFKNNVFFESEGALVLRHGNYARIDGNVFIGNDNSKFIGGIRVVNTGHWITNNYFYKLKGENFWSPLAIMNGIPKSPMNRYNQVTDVVVAYNTYIDCISPWHFSVGSNVDESDVLPKSEIRSARPTRVLMANNMIYNHSPQKKPIVAYDTVDGVDFKMNILNSVNDSKVQDEGIVTEYSEMKQVSKYLYVPKENKEDVYQGFDFETIKRDLFGNDRTHNNSVGAITLPIKDDTILLNKELYGPNWFKPEKKSKNPRIFQVSDANELIEKVKGASSGDIIELESGSYSLSATIKIDKRLTIRSKNKNKKVKLEFFGNNSLPGFQMLPNGNLVLDNVVLIGNKKRSAFGTLENNMSKAYNLWVRNTEISDFENLLTVSKTSFADTISIENSTIKNLKRGIQLAEETDDNGEYNAEFVYIKNSKFKNIKEDVLNYYRGGYDESTIGGNLVLTGNTIENSGFSENTEILFKTRGIMQVKLANNTFLNNPVKYIAILWGAKGQKPKANSIKNSGEVKIEENLEQTLMY